MARKGLIEAVAYLRTSSATNVGEDKDSAKRQRAAIEAFAKRAGYAIVDSFNDAAVSGEDDIGERPGFSAMLDRIESNGVRVVIVEDASRFARKVLTQELGIVALASRGVTVWSAAGEMNLTETDDEYKIAMRQIAAVFAELEKRRLVKKLKAARDRKKAETGKCGGRKSYAERDAAMVELAKKLHRYPVNGRRRSLRDVSAELAAAGYASAAGTPFPPASIARMIGAANANAVRNAKADARARGLTDVLAEIRAGGATSLREIASALNARGIPAARGGKWSAPQVSCLVARIA